MLGDVALATTAYLIAGLSLLASIAVKRARDAVGLAYLLTAVWLFLPGAAGLLLASAPDQGPRLAGDARESPRVGLAGEPAGRDERLRGPRGRVRRALAAGLVDGGFAGGLRDTLRRARLLGAPAVVPQAQGEVGRPNRSVRLARSVVPRPGVRGRPDILEGSPPGRATGGSGGGSSASPCPPC